MSKRAKRMRAERSVSGSFKNSARRVLNGFRAEYRRALGRPSESRRDPLGAEKILERCGGDSDLAREHIAAAFDRGERPRSLLALANAEDRREGLVAGGAA